MSTFLGVLFLIVIIVFFAWIWPKIKRNTVAKGRYETELSLTGQAISFTTTASLDQVKRSLDNYLPTDDSVTGSFVGGKYKKIVVNANHLQYHHSSHITVGGSGDEFTASITFQQRENGLMALLQIDRWREKNGVTRQAGIKAMQEFVDTVKSAFLAADRSCSIKTIGK